MNDELTAVDIKKMQEELDYRRIQLRPQLIEDVKTAREFGDLSENFEYKSAKREKGRNESRIRYLERMIKTAKVIKAESQGNGVGLLLNSPNARYVNICFGRNRFEDNGTGLHIEALPGDWTLDLSKTVFSGNETDINNLANCRLDTSEAIFQ